MVIGDGRAVANALIKAGCSKLALADKDDDGLRAIEASSKALGFNVEVLCLKCDVVVPEEIDAVITAIAQRFGSINYCANCLRPQPEMILEHKTVRDDSEWSLEMREMTSAWQRGVSLFHSQVVKGSFLSNCAYLSRCGYGCVPK